MDLIHLISRDERSVGQGYLVHDGDGGVCFRDFCNKIADSIGMKPINNHIPCVAAYGAAVIMEALWELLRIRSRPPITTYVVKNLGSRHHYSIEKAARELGWRPKISFEQGFAKTLADLKTAFDLEKRQWQ
jgi:nucleoside-diphosphate-sugar epimerase